jgi:hypothetical protein
MRDLIREYFEVVQSIGPDDKVGERLARDLWRQMTAEQQQEVRRLHRQPCKGYDESCRPSRTAN